MSNEPRTRLSLLELEVEIKKVEISLLEGAIERDKEVLNEATGQMEIRKVTIPLTQREMEGQAQWLKILREKRASKFGDATDSQETKIQLKGEIRIGDLLVWSMSSNPRNGLTFRVERKCFVSNDSRVPPEFTVSCQEKALVKVFDEPTVRSMFKRAEPK